MRVISLSHCCSLIGIFPFADKRGRTYSLSTTTNPVCSPARPAELHKAAVELEEDYSRVVARAQKEASDATVRAARVQEELERALASERERAATAGERTRNVSTRNASL